MSDLVSRVSSIAWSAEQCVVYFTLTVIGASIGLLEGTYKGLQKLQPNFRSREGLEELIYGSDHKGDRGSIKDLLLSWIPGARPSKMQNQPNLKHLKGRQEGKSSHAYTNGVAPEAGEALKEPPVATSDKPLKSQVDIPAHTIQSFYSEDSELSSAKPGTPDIVSHKPEIFSHRPNTPSSEHHTWDNASFTTSTQQDELSSLASYDRGASSDAEVTVAAADSAAPSAPGKEPKKKRKGLKKLKKGLERVFVEPFEKLSHRASSCSSSPKKAKA